jgi:hypothetical protein
MLRNLFAVGDDDGCELAGEEPSDRLAQCRRGQTAQVRGFRRTYDLNAERVDEIHVPDLADGGLQLHLAGEHAVAPLAAGEPVEPQPRLVFRVELLDADLAYRNTVVHDGEVSQVANSRCRPAASLVAAS